ncbi:MAG: hypothetical protein NC133_02625 [Prevotella sp.]|nr:hypothetical protein [Prevotella sp.]
MDKTSIIIALETLEQKYHDVNGYAVQQIIFAMNIYPITKKCCVENCGQ